MDKSITDIAALPVWRETRFRQPSPFEQRLGLWVDRIGAGGNAPRELRHLRILGQYAAVAVEEGAGRYVMQNRGQGVLRTGDVIFLTPAEPAAYAPGAAWFTRWIVWSGPEAQLLMDLQLLDTRAPVFQHAAAAVREAFFALARCMDGEDLTAAMERKIILLKMLAELRRRRQLRGHAHEAALAAVVDYIGRRLETRLPVAELAQLAHLSIPHFRRLFESYTGRAPVAFIAAQRIARAKSLLAHGVPIKDAATQVGYADPAYFMRVFRQVAGETAGQFLAK